MTKTSTHAAANTIANQAARLGYTVERDTAATGSVYLTLCHDRLDGDRLIRVADHEPNEARYVYRINAEPDLDVDPGFQAAAVRHLAEWIGTDPARVPYLRRIATIEAKRRAERERVAAERQAMRAAAVATAAALYDNASAADRVIADHYRTLAGKPRKYYRRRHAETLRRTGDVH